jgi:plastocyanin
MVLKAVIIAVSIVAIVLTAVIIGAVIIVGQVLANDPNIRNEIRQSLEGGGSEQNSQEERSSSSSLPITEEGNVVSIVGNSGGNSYNPNPIEIKVGDTVTWINDDSSPHTVTSSNDISTFDSNVLRRGETFSFTFDKEGEYPYFCTLHPKMVGTVLVTAS